MKYRKKPVVVYAVQYMDSHDLLEIEWIKQARKRGEIKIFYNVENPDDGTEFVEIHTLEGIVRAGFTDWIIRGVEGELYPCKNSVFQKTYEPEDTE